MQNEPIDPASEEEEEYKKNLEVVEMLDPEMLAMAIINEHPQTQALIISTLTHTGNAARIINALPDKIQADVAYRILHMLPVPRQVYREVFKILMRDLKASEATTASSKDAGLYSFVEMLQLADEEVASNLLSKLDKAMADRGVTSDLLVKAKEIFKENKETKPND